MNKNLLELQHTFCIELKAGDFVYLEIIQSNEEEDTYTIRQLPGTYFNGHIVVAL